MRGGAINNFVTACQMRPHPPTPIHEMKNPENLLQMNLASGFYFCSKNKLQQGPGCGGGKMNCQTRERRDKETDGRRRKIKPGGPGGARKKTDQKLCTTFFSRPRPVLIFDESIDSTRLTMDRGVRGRGSSPPSRVVKRAPGEGGGGE